MRRASIELDDPSREPDAIHLQSREVDAGRRTLPGGIWSIPLELAASCRALRIEQSRNQPAADEERAGPDPLRTSPATQ